MSEIEKWVNEYADQMFSWALYKTSENETAQDLVQETFLSAVKAFETFKGKSSPKTWLFSILNNKIIDHHRKRFRNLEINQSKISAENENMLENIFDNNGDWRKKHKPVKWPMEEDNLLDDPTFNHVLQTCIENLQNKLGSVVEMKYISDKDSKEICQDLNITPSNFWQLLHRSKIKLRVCIEKNWFENLA